MEREGHMKRNLSITIAVASLFFILPALAFSGTVKLSTPPDDMKTKKLATPPDDQKYKKKLSTLPDDNKFKKNAATPPDDIKSPKLSTPPDDTKFKTKAGTPPDDTKFKKRAGTPPDDMKTRKLGTPPDDQRGTITRTVKLGCPPDDNKILIPLIHGYKTELVKANHKLKNFDLDKGQTLSVITETKVSVPAMLEINESLAAEFKRLRSVKGVNKTALRNLENRSNRLNGILTEQLDNETDLVAFTGALNKMSSIMVQMEHMIR